MISKREPEEPNEGQTTPMSLTKDIHVYLYKRPKIQTLDFQTCLSQILGPGTTNESLGFEYSMHSQKNNRYDILSSILKPMFSQRKTKGKPLPRCLIKQIQGLSKEPGNQSNTH